MRLEDVRVTFDARGIAGLHGVSLHVRPGETFVVMGANGAGKTTLLRVLSGELRPHSGKVQTLERVAHMDVKLALSSDDSIQAWLMKAIKRPLDDEKKLQLARDLADAFEFPLQLKRRLSEVSEGQRQRARLACALIDGPELLLLDEPFAHLDAPLRFELLALLKKYTKEREVTVVWVTHQRDEALATADRLGVLHLGKFEQIGTPEDVFWQPKSLVVAQLLGHQNFVTVTRHTPAEPFQTPFGPWRSQGAGPGKTHLVLAIPAEAFQLDPQGSFAGVIEAVRFQGHHSELILRNSGQSWTVRYPGRQLSLEKLGESRRFNVQLSQAVGIDCL